MENIPTFSIILATYNRAHLLPRAISSVLSQSYENYELLIVDDGSTDNTKQVVHSFNDQRIRYYSKEKNVGVLNSWNIGLNNAIGKYIYFFCDDDELTQGALELIIQQIDNFPLEKNKFFWFDCIDAETNSFSGTGLRGFEKKIVYLDLLCGKIRGDYAVVFNREAFGTNRFDERLWGMEGLLWLKLHKQYDGYYFPKVILKAYRNHGVRICNTSILLHLSHYILGETIYLNEFGDELKSMCPHRYGEHLSNLGYYQMLDGQKNNAKENMLSSLKYRFSIKLLIFYIMSYFLSKQQVIFLCRTFKQV